MFKQLRKLPTNTESPFGTWRKTNDGFRPTPPSDHLEADWLKSNPGIEIGVGYWYGGCDDNMSSTAFRNAAGEISYLDQRYWSLSNFLQGKRS